MGHCKFENQRFFEARSMFRIPSGLQQIIPPAAAKKVLELLHQPVLTQAVKDAAQKIGWPEMQASGQVQEIWQQAKQWLESTLQSGHPHHPLASAVINGTGKIFDSTLGGVPLPLGIADQAARMLSYMTASSIEESLRETLCSQSGAEDALVVCSVEHAVGLLNHLPLAADGWLVPRGDYVSWNADSHFGNCLDTSTKASIAIGSTTHCSENDLIQGLKGTRHGVLRLSPNRAMSVNPTGGANNVNDLPYGVDLRQAETKNPVVHAELLLDGTLLDLQTSVFPFVQAASRLKSGTSIVIIPGDRLLGGPGCGIVLGSKDCVSVLREAATKLRLKAQPLLACMLQLIVSKQVDVSTWRQHPVGAMLTNSLANLQDRAKRLEFQIQSGVDVVSCRTIERDESIGDFVWEKYKLPGVSLQIELKNLERWAEHIQRDKGLTILADRSGNSLTIQLRSIDPADDRLLADLFPTTREKTTEPGTTH